MTLFPDKFIEDIRRLSAARHSFLHQICGPEGRRHRNMLQTLMDELGEPIGSRVGCLLTSLDNRRFFQGYAELATAALLARGPYRVRVLVEPGPILRAKRPNGATLDLTVLSFIHKSRPVPDRATLRRLVEALERIGGNHRILLALHRWLPHDLDTEPVRRAVEMWLAQVEAGTWEGRYATYEDEKISLEFMLSDDRSSGGRRVLASVGPFLSPASLAAVEPQVLRELEIIRTGPNAGRPLIMVCVADQPWRVTSGYMRDFLYGPSARIEMFRDGEDHNIELEFGGEYSPCLFRDPLYRDLAAFLWLGRDTDDPTALYARCYLNPWAAEPLDADFLPLIMTLAPVQRQADSVVMAWRKRSGSRFSLI